MPSVSFSHFSFSSGEVPPLCLNAVLSIEDSKFYEHPGISVTGLLRWLEQRGLTINEDDLPIAPVWGWVRVTGEYKATRHLSYDDFYALPAIAEIKVMSNGDYTLGRITEENGVRNVHELNPNCKQRPVFDYRATALEVL